MTKKRVYQIAKELNLSSKEMISKLEELGIEASSHMSTLEDEEVKTILDLFAAEKTEETPVEETPIPPTQAKPEESAKEAPKKKKNRKKKNRKTFMPAQKQEETQVEAAEDDGLIQIDDTITVKDLAEKLDIAANALIGKLMMAGTMASINESISFETAELMAMEFGIEIVKKEKESLIDLNLDPEDPEELLQFRAPIVTVMGHVDHGKTSLLDALRDTAVTEREAGGITQHIGASSIKVNDKEIVFLDTPGHEAFTSMRARGAQVTDIAILVVAADDGVMPQTIEAINHSKAAGVPIIVAINKIDKPAANPDRVLQELNEHGLFPEAWGGDIITVNVSAQTREGLDELMEMILLVAEMEELKANPDRLAVGTVVESRLDSQRGPVATIVVNKGTLHVGDPIFSGVAVGKVRALINDKGRRVKMAGPSTPVEVLGLSETPEAGANLYAVQTERMAKAYASANQETVRQAKYKTTKRVSLEDLYEQLQLGEMQDLNLIIKADVKGSIEAVKQSLLKLSNEEVTVNPIHGGVGAITDTDIMLASASNAIIIGFNVRPTTSALTLADQEHVDVRTYRIIYKAIEDVEAAIRGMLAPEFKEVVQGRAEVRATFKVPNAGTVAGIYVTDGKITRNSEIRLLRDNIVIFDGKLTSLRRFKDDVKEVLTGYEGGLGIENYNDIKDGDVIEAFIMEEIKR
ncbi:translation initiation factor IF-2 [Gottschalkiaceae bacterium SANA]|nr:translation initiation factor IF-2 [Gottschalkiaceae bacterium SANA]